VNQRGHPAGWAERFTPFLIHDRAVVWEWLHRHPERGTPGTFRDYVYSFLAHFDAQLFGSGEVEFRAAILDDCASIVACVHAAYGKYVDRIGQAPAPMLADYAALVERGVVHVLYRPATGEVIGVIVLWPTEGAVFVENVAVHPRYQGQGLGRRLMAFAEEEATAANLRVVTLYTNEAMTENLAFYARLGFEETGRRMDDGYRRVFLRKNLM
jgi:ribosomal protein S18 acetylase RimI-like enzyme